MTVLMIDNYDSFTYNLVQYFGELGAQVVTLRNDEATVDELVTMKPRAVVISPGPCTPRQAGVSMQAIAAFAGVVPVLGVCLGHQAIGMHFGARLTKAARVMHGKVDRLQHTNVGVFAGLPASVDVVRYHSLAITDLPDCLEPTAQTSDGEIMGIRHRELDVEGVQFHPESIESEYGHQMLYAFLQRAGIEASLPAG
ncbi:MAG: aminodeoxychorismate/anthranilate synthase component II [Burkholderiaceae bacterium]